MKRPSLHITVTVSTCETQKQTQHRTTTTHLGSTNDRLAGNVGSTNQILLSQEDFLWWKIHSQVTPSNHDAVGLLQDGVKTERKEENKRLALLLNQFESQQEWQENYLLQRQISVLTLILAYLCLLPVLLQ